MPSKKLKLHLKNQSCTRIYRENKNIKEAVYHCLVTLCLQNTFVMHGLDYTANFLVLTWCCSIWLLCIFLAYVILSSWAELKSLSSFIDIHICKDLSSLYLLHCQYSCLGIGAIVHFITGFIFSSMNFVFVLFCQVHNLLAFNRFTLSPTIETSFFQLPLMGWCVYLILMGTSMMMMIWNQ